MDSIDITPSANNKRLEQPDSEQHWHLLSTAQIFAFYTLTKIGFQLLFVRQSSDEKLAVARQDHKIITIDSTGEIDFNPVLILRENIKQV
ncbi:hypothetical protein HQQ94_20060 [Shewanella sp. VB17]|uniref:hypothetical protein n=1 Tax=Shewanella sp. VB17 TaxID=2739432 RepID=UPI001567021A|nr:hypothetical protein [Shewanella sp. VB17]NRD75471.1 hypothetical protein [Shewanella sp. VB17]